jgi:hypothetical protein
MLTFGTLIFFVLIVLLFACIDQPAKSHEARASARLNQPHVHRDAMFGDGIGLHTDFGLTDPFEGQRCDEELQRSRDFTDYTFLTHSDLLNPHIGMGLGMGVDHADNSMFSDADHMGGTDSSYHSMD